MADGKNGSSKVLEHAKMTKFTFHLFLVFAIFHFYYKYLLFPKKGCLQSSRSIYLGIDHTICTTLLNMDLCLSLSLCVGIFCNLILLLSYLALSSFLSIAMDRKKKREEQCMMEMDHQNNNNNSADDQVFRPFLSLIRCYHIYIWICIHIGMHCINLTCNWRQSEWMRPKQGSWLEMILLW